jgi:hydrogenase expression/formation protein HypE
MSFPDTIDLSMNGGGKRMDLLIKFISDNIAITNDHNDIIGPQDADDSAVIQITANDPRIVITTDSHTIDPLRFRGGDIGKLAICGTTNDLVVMGCKPLYITLSMIIEEGFSSITLAEICKSIRKELEKTNIRVVAGDTKIMPKGTLSGMIINTAGFGILEIDKPWNDASAEAGDVIIVSGSIGDHGTSLMAMREGIDLDTDLPSDVASLWPEFEDLHKLKGIKAMKDITRGGLSSCLAEIAMKSDVNIEIEETKLPIKPEAQAICDILGLEIMEISCEGRVIIIVSADETSEVLDVLSKYPVTKDATIIGKVNEKPKGIVYVKTEIGGTRIMDKPYGEPIPRVC